MKGELLEDAVRRKVKEETGFEVATIESLGTEETLFPDGPFEKPTHTINVVFRTTLLSPETTGEADAQHAKMQWFKELPDNLHPYIRKYIERALQAGT